MDIDEGLIDKAKGLAGEKLGIDRWMIDSVTSMLGLGGDQHPRDAEREGEDPGDGSDGQDDQAGPDEETGDAEKADEDDGAR